MKIPCFFLEKTLWDIVVHSKIKEGERGSSVNIFSVVAFSSLFTSIWSFLAGTKGNKQMYWLAALGMYIFSFLAGFSIGQVTVGLTFIPLILVIGFSFGWIKNNRHYWIFLSLGVLIGFLMVIFVGDILFYPFIPFFS